jgi:hypothetical protein
MRYLTKMARKRYRMMLYSKIKILKFLRGSALGAKHISIPAKALEGHKGATGRCGAVTSKLSILN